MRLTFRAKLMAIVGTSAAAFLLLIVASTLIANRVEGQLAAIRLYHLPKIELGPRLEAGFAQLRRALQDAVAAHDSDALAKTKEIEDRLLADLAAARDVVNPADAKSLRSAIQDYQTTALDVSRRLIAGETGEAVVHAVTDLQTKQARVAELLKNATAFDRRELTEAFATASRAQTTGARLRLLISVGCLVSVILLSFWLSGGVLRSLAELSAGFSRFAKGDFTVPIRVLTRDEIGDVGGQANQMAENLGRLLAERDRTDWIKSGFAGLIKDLQGELEPGELADRAIRHLARYLEAPVGAIYYVNRDHTLDLLGRYALAPQDTEDPAARFRMGEGLVGQAALQEELTVISDLPVGHLRVRSGLGESSPASAVLVPLVHAGRVRGVVELGLLRPLSEAAAELLVTVRQTLAIKIEVAFARSATRQLLEETQRQQQRLLEQDEELRATNEELQAQQEELRQTNEELRQLADELDTQRRALQLKNAELDDATHRLAQKAEELTTVSAYKSQFLTNMSHELRTPLNSMLLLSNLLAENEEGNLTLKQVEYCRTVHSAGKDLLTLINQVLDLAKVEAGKQELRIEPVSLRQILERAESAFGPMARERGLAFRAEMHAGLPETVATDRQRLEQILNNLIGNAIKFTQQGSITLAISRSAGRIAFTVSDTGPGIAPEHQQRIFAPFEQIEGASDRRYGGTGLGLTIARELAHLLGGELQLSSEVGKGSTFVCYLPGEPAAPTSAAPPLRVAADTSESNGAYLLIIEDDQAFAQILGDVIASRGLKYEIAQDGQSGLRLARQQRPSGIILDVKLPDIDGWKVMSELQNDPRTAAVPVHFISAIDASDRGLAMGAVGYLTKPSTPRQLLDVVDSLVPSASRRARRVLIVEDDVPLGESLVKQLTGENIEARHVSSAREALNLLRREVFGCVILDLGLADMGGLEFLESLQRQSGDVMPSVVVHTARALSKAEVTRLESYAEAVVLKEGHSSERLLNEIRLFARRLQEGTSRRRRPSERLHPVDVQLEGKQILIADDDMRTVYALSAMLRARGMGVHVADTGRAAIDMLAQHPDVHAVLMDIMMPEMDGYEAMRRIRQQERFRDLPIIALTAKAMKGDREKCLEAGATDYLSKPIEPNRLLTLLHTRLSGTRDGA